MKPNAKQANRYLSDITRHRYYATSSMHRSLAIKLNGYWAKKTATSIHENPLENVWVIFDTDSDVICADGFGRMPKKDLDTYINNPDNYPTYKGEKLFDTFTVLNARRNLESRKDVIGRLNIHRSNEDIITDDKVIAWFPLITSLIPNNIVTSTNAGDYQSYLNRFNINRAPIIRSNFSEKELANEAFVISELIEIRYLNFSEKTNKYFLVRIDKTGKVSNEEDELSTNDNDAGYTIIGLNVSGYRAISKERLSKYYTVDWMKHKILNNNRAINNIWLIFSDVFEEKKYRFGDTFLTPFNDFNVDVLNDNNWEFRSLCQRNDKHGLFQEVLQLNNSDKKNDSGSIKRNNDGIIAIPLIVKPSDRGYKSLCNSFGINNGQLIYNSTVWDNDMHDYEYDGFVIESTNNKQICNIRKSGKYTVYDSNHNLLREGMYISRNEKKDIKNHILYSMDIFKAIKSDL